MTDKVKGPASYFPSIEAKHGRPVAEWLAEIDARLEAEPTSTHMTLVGWLKHVHGLGHGHANALVAHALGPRKEARP